MGRVLHPLLFLLARCTKNQLIRQIEFFKVENQILRIPVLAESGRLPSGVDSSLRKAGLGQ